jgi:hypothetical protein
VTHRRLLRLAQARRRLLHLRRASGCLGTSRGSSRGSSSTTSPRVCSSSTTSPTPRVRVPRHVARLVVDYFTYAARPVASTRRAACRVTRRRLLRLRRASGCLDTSRGLSRDSSSTTSPTPRVRVPRHVARLVTRLVVDYFTYAARPVASARRAACRLTHRRLLRLRRASRCLGTSRGSSRGSSSTTSPRAGSSPTTSPTPRVRVPRHVARLVVDYFTYVVRLGASARRAAHRAARRRLLHLCRASGCLGTSRSSSRGSSSTTSTTPRVRVPRHVARLITRLVAPLVIDYFAYAARPSASTRRVAHLAAHRRLLRLCRTSGCLGTSRGSSRGSSSTTPCAKTSSYGHTGSTSATPCVATTCLAVTLALLRVRRALP